MSLKFRKGGAAGNQSILSVIHTVLHACLKKRGGGSFFKCRSHISLIAILKWGWGHSLSPSLDTPLGTGEKYYYKVAHSGNT